VHSNERTKFFTFTLKSAGAPQIAHRVVFTSREGRDQSADLDKSASELIKIIAGANEARIDERRGFSWHAGTYPALTRSRQRRPHVTYGALAARRLSAAGENIPKVALQAIHDLLQSAKSDALLASLQAMQRRGRQAEFTRKIRKSLIASSPAKELSELLIKRTRHRTVLP
jgi:hypothetical protein